jgi:hypothetical protein
VTQDKNTELFTHIAKQHLGVDTLELWRDQLDFHSISVASFESALRTAYEAGIRHANSAEDDEQGAEMHMMLNRLESLYTNNAEEWRVQEEPHNYPDGTTHFTHVLYTAYDVEENPMTIMIGRYVTPDLAELLVLEHNNLPKLIRLARLGLDNRA